jgi:uncharacterized protein HemY
MEVLVQAEQALGMGLLDRAERLYRQAAEADPRNAVAVTGLSRVALDRGDDAGALRLAWRALAMDPQNAVARRLAERLEEVLRTRGDTLPVREVST